MSNYRFLFAFFLILLITTSFLSCTKADSEEVQNKLQISINYSISPFPFFFFESSVIHYEILLKNIGSKTFNGTFSVSDGEYRTFKLNLSPNESFLLKYDTSAPVAGIYNLYVANIEENNLGKIDLYIDSKLIDSGNRVSTRNYPIITTIYPFSYFTSILGLGASIILVILTAYYARATRRTVEEMKRPRLEKERRIALLHDLEKELFTISFNQNFYERSDPKSKDRELLVLPVINAARQLVKKVDNASEEEKNFLRWLKLDLGIKFLATTLLNTELPNQEKFKTEIYVITNDLRNQLSSIIQQLLLGRPLAVELQKLEELRKRMR